MLGKIAIVVFYVAIYGPQKGEEEQTNHHRNKKNTGGRGARGTHLESDKLDVLGLHSRLVDQLVRVNVCPCGDGRYGCCRRCCCCRRL